MIYVFDTNIIFTSLHNQAFDTYIASNYRIEGNDLVISSVTVGELKALALKRNWGNRRQKQLLDVIAQYIIHPIKMQAILDNYANLDAYSQSKLVNKPLPKGVTARNMGKNDLWIAATAYTINAKLVTTDKDFDHLNNSFIEIDRINLSPFI